MTGSVTVLLVEDDDRIAAFITRAVASLGFTIEWVATGQAGLDRVARGDIGALILDLGLPDIDGLDVLRALRADGREVPTIIVTARTDDWEIARSLGAVRYLRKPFPLHDLLDAVRSSMETSTPSARSSDPAAQ